MFSAWWSILVIGIISLQSNVIDGAKCECPTSFAPIKKLDMPVSDCVVGLSSVAIGTRLETASGKVFNVPTLDIRYSLSISTMWFAGDNFSAGEVFTASITAPSCCGSTFTKVLSAKRDLKSEYRAVINTISSANPLLPDIYYARTCKNPEDETMGYHVCSPPLQVLQMYYTSATVAIPYPIFDQMEDIAVENHDWMMIINVRTEPGYTSKPVYKMEAINMKEGLRGITLQNLKPSTTYYVEYESRNVIDLSHAYPSKQLQFTTHGLPTISCQPKAEQIVCDAPAADPANWKLKYTVTDFSNPLLPYRVYGAENVVVQVQEYPKKTLQVQSLRPGTPYRIDWTFTAANGEVHSGNTMVNTSCTCDSESSQHKVGLSTTQRRGKVFFEFYGDSLCGDAYAFARSEVGSGGKFIGHDIFAPNYFFHRGTQGGCPILYSPGEDAADDFKRSSLQVGKSYRYSVRPVGPLYQGPPIYTVHQALWEASVAGYVGLSKRVGNLPVDRVDVLWTLYDLDNNTIAQDKVQTSLDGKFSIDIQDDDEVLTNSGEYVLTLQFSKKTNINGTFSIDHKFACLDGRVDCSSQPLTLFVKHLDFDIPVDVVDTTSVPVSGKIYIANTTYDDSGKGWGKQGCPMNNVSVCLINKGTGENYNQEMFCVETNQEGYYFLPASIASKVSIKARLEGHEFSYVPQNKDSLDLEKGFVVEAGKIYELNDFEDITTRKISITVAGGKCDRSFVESKMRIKVDRCDWGGRSETLYGLRDEFQVPAAAMDIRVQSIKDRSDISLASQRIDLSNMTDVDVIPDVRFEYQGKASLKVVFNRNLNRVCDKVETLDDDDSREVSTNVVLPFNEIVTATIYVRRDLGGDRDNFCDIVDENSEISITNGLGLIADYREDDDYRKRLIDIYHYDENVIGLLEHCNRGCTAKVKHDIDPETQRPSNARVEFVFMTGRPNIHMPYTKSLLVRTLGQGPVEHQVEAIIVGQYLISNTGSVPLPTYEPILIIRDPPGGGSSAYYKNVQTTIRLENLDISEYYGMDISGDVSMGVNMKIGSCVGLGQTFCATLTKTKTKLGYATKNRDTELQDNFKKDSYSGGFTTTWSYTTSKDPLFAGKFSDVFVVPSLNVQYIATDVLKWDQSVCLVWKKHETTFSLTKSETIPAISFLTAYQIENNEIPRLQTLAKSTEEAIAQCPDPETCKSLKQKLESLEDGIKGWRNSLSLNKETKEMAKNGTLMKPHEWFSGIAKPSINGSTFDLDGLSHHSGFISETLGSRLRLRDAYKSQNSSATDLTSLNTLKFSGGGSSLTYELNRNKIAEYVSRLGGSDENYNDNHAQGGKGSTENTIGGFYIDGALSVGWATDFSMSHLQTDNAEDATAIGFTLSDGDIGDVFDVEVFIDPRFGTFVFNTVSGASMCPHELNTDYRVIPELALARQPSKIALPNDPMLFEISLTNSGDFPSPMVLKIDTRYDVGESLRFVGFPISFERVNPGETVYATLSVTRGYGKYDFKPIQILAQVGCEAGLDAKLNLVNESSTATLTLYNKVVNNEKRVVFSQECPKVEFAGALQKSNTFVVNTNENNNGKIPVTIRNPGSGYMSLANAVKDPSTRLKVVRLWYRMVGASRWERGLHIEDNQLVEIDFTRVKEDSFGFIQVDWEVSGILDGEYEMKIESECVEIPNSPLIYNKFSTAVLRGFIDKEPPRIFGFPTPIKRLPIGDVIEIEFDKPLECHKPFLFQVDMDIDGTHYTKDNLQISCETRYISIQFARDFSEHEDLVGKRLEMTLSKVVDSHGNMMNDEIKYEAELVAMSTSRSTKRRYLGEDFGLFRESLNMMIKELDQPLMKRVLRG